MTRTFLEFIIASEIDPLILIRNNFNKDYTILSDNILKNIKPIYTMTIN
jgi:hypothetical protein